MSRRKAFIDTLTIAEREQIQKDLRRNNRAEAETKLIDGRAAKGQDGSPMGRTFTVVGSTGREAEANAFRVAHATGWRPLVALYTEQVEAGWWDVTIAYEADSPAVAR